MEEITCAHCDGTGTSPWSGGACHVCGGGGNIEPTVTGVHNIIKAYAIENYEKLLAVETKLDTLQADMDIIKPQIAALYEDLNP